MRASRCSTCVSDGAARLGVLTDIGISTRHVEQMLSGLDALVLECNYDRDMLWSGGYPRWLKERIGGPFGHLDNRESGAPARRARPLEAEAHHRRAPLAAEQQARARARTPCRARSAASRTGSASPPRTTASTGAKLNSGTEPDLDSGTEPELVKNSRLVSDSEIKRRAGLSCRAACPGFVGSSSRPLADELIAFSFLAERVARPPFVRALGSRSRKHGIVRLMPRRCEYGAPDDSSSGKRDGTSTVRQQRSGAHARPIPNCRRSSTSDKRSSDHRHALTGLRSI